MTLKNKNIISVAFTGGGTGGHIYPGLAVANELLCMASEEGRQIKIYWIGNSSGMDRKIVETGTDSSGRRSADVFYGIPSGKLRRYVSFKNFIDLFKIFGGLIVSFFILLKIKPAVLFSKGGFVSVPPCIIAKLLGVPVYTHESDFTPGLATRINSRAAKHILLSYKETAEYLNAACRSKAVITGNPVRPSFYSADAEKGFQFLQLHRNTVDKPVLLVIGGSLGARQINELVYENLEWLCSRFFVVHQTGIKNAEETAVKNMTENIASSYKPYPFIYSEMPDVIAAADIVLSRAGANSIWECAVLGKPLVLVPLCGAGTRGDQEDNAMYFEKAGAAVVLAREAASSERLRDVLQNLQKPEIREKYASAAAGLAAGRHPAEKIADLIYNEITGGLK